jgi:hypothetical protein
MKPIKFPEANKLLGKPTDMTDDECGPLLVFNNGYQSVSCWKMTWRERLSALFFGKVWLWVVAGRTQPPVSLEATRTIFEKVDVEGAENAV